MERSDRVKEAARRRADEVLSQVASDALGLQANASLHGSMGGSRHLLELAKICREGLTLIARAASSAIEEYDVGSMGSYSSAFEAILQAARPKLIDIFRDFGGEAPSFGRMSPMEQRELDESLGSAISNLCSEFELRASTVTASDMSSDENWKFAILRYFSKLPRAHRINVLGRPFQPGHLESDLGVKFSDAQRVEVGRCLNELLREGFLVPTYEDMADPENWLTITDPGREASKRGALDELDEALAALNPHFPGMRRGAWAAGLSGNPDSVRHAASSARELLGQVLAAVAPTAEIKSVPGFVPSKESKDGITRKMRFRHAMRKRPSGLSDSDLEVILGAEALLDPLFAKLNALTHERGASNRDIRAFLQSTEMLLEMLLF